MFLSSYLTYYLVYDLLLKLSTSVDYLWCSTVKNWPKSSAVLTGLWIWKCWLTHLLLRLKQTLQIRDNLSFAILGLFSLLGEIFQKDLSLSARSAVWAVTDVDTNKNEHWYLKANDFLANSCRHSFKVSLVLRHFGLPLFPKVKITEES